jgi:hypothetical protein
VKFSVRQILASAAGAVLAALIASVFGVKGTIIGVAIGSAAATFGTALVAQSIERGQRAVKQVVVRAPDSPTFLRRLGGTGASGTAEPTVAASSRSTAAGAEAETVDTTSAPAPVEETRRLVSSATAGTPDAETLRATTRPVTGARPGPPRRFTWSAIAKAAAIVFVLALLFVTAVELIAGKPFAALFGDTGTGTTVKNLFAPSPAPSSTTSTTTSSTTTSSSTTPTSTTTSTTAPTSRSTTTTSSPSPTTTTTGVGATSTTTTPASRPASP